MKITLEISISAYPIAMLIHEGSLSLSEGQRLISRTTGMNEGSALSYVTIF